MVNQPDDPNQAQAWISGTPPDQTIDFYIPRGNTGPRGPVGPIGPSLAVGSVATVTGPAAPGTPGIQGATGPKGDPGGLVLGTLITGPADLNDYKTPGSYRTTTTTSISNLPALFVGTLTVWQNNNATPMFWQEYTPVTSGGAQLFWRRALGPSQVWGPWRVYASTRVDQTAGRVIYQWDDVNLREQIIYGDTGWRDITSLMSNSFLGNVLVRRVGSTITVRGSVKCPVGTTSMNGIFLSALPSGFAGASSPWIFFPVRCNGNPGFFTLYKRAAELSFETSPVVTELMETRFEVSFSTVEAWPTTLPGTASGSIPA